MIDFVEGKKTFHHRTKKWYMIQNIDVVKAYK